MSSAPVLFYCNLVALAADGRPPSYDDVTGDDVESASEGVMEGGDGNAGTVKNSYWRRVRWWNRNDGDIVTYPIWAAEPYRVHEF